MCESGEPAQLALQARGGFGCSADALAAVTAGLSWLAAAGAAELTVAEHADCLRGLGAAESQLTAARSAVLAAFDDVSGYQDDGAAGPRSWLAWQTASTTAAAAAAVAWMRRLRRHPAVAAALSDGTVSVSWGRAICDWTDRLPPDCRGSADQILLDAAAGGAELADLAGLAEELYMRAAPPSTDPDDDGFQDRSLRLDRHWRGAGKLEGNLTPQCAAAVQAMLEALAKKAGPADDRTQPQRNHDALEEACRRLAGAGFLPDRAGQSTQIQLHMTLADLLGQQAAGGAASGWAGAGPAAGPGDACDAAIAPVVTGHPDPDILDRLARTLLRQDRQQPGPGTGAGVAGQEAGGGRGSWRAAAAARAARMLILDRAVALLSGPAGLAAHLRTRLLSGPAGSMSLPLDVGAATETIPAHLRRAVITRDRHCAFPGCPQPPAACHVHHIVPRADGGTTSLANCLLLCSFHHLIAVHRWGWTIALHPDGTTTATSRDRIRVLRSHAPPEAAARSA